MTKVTDEDRLFELIELTAKLMEEAIKKKNGELIHQLSQTIMNLESARANYWKATANSWEAVCLKTSYDKIKDAFNKLPDNPDIEFGKEVS